MILRLFAFFLLLLTSDAFAAQIRKSAADQKKAASTEGLFDFKELFGSLNVLKDLSPMSSLDIEEPVFFVYHRHPAWSTAILFHFGPAETVWHAA